MIGRMGFSGGSMHQIETTQTANAFPPLVRIRQTFDRPRLENIEEAVTRELNSCGVSIPSGKEIAVAVGSRGIANLALIVRTVCAWVRSNGGKPFIVPTMGSHGGGTAEGQRSVLESYGVVEAYTGAPIRASMEVVELESNGLPVPVYFDRNAFGAAGTIVINRIKVHTDFHGPYESGLMKMIVIGLGKHAQALAVHRYGTYGLREIIPQVARASLLLAQDGELHVRLAQELHHGARHLLRPVVVGGRTAHPEQVFRFFSFCEKIRHYRNRLSSPVQAIFSRILPWGSVILYITENSFQLTRCRCFFHHKVPAHINNQCRMIYIDRTFPCTGVACCAGPQLLFGDVIS